MSLSLGHEEVGDPMIWPTNKTYGQYVAGGKLALESAIENERIFGLDASVHLYEAASTQFLGAIGSAPVIEGTHEIEETDPILLIQYASCLLKQSQASKVEPYKSEQSRHINRRDNLALIAKNTFRVAWERISSASEPSDETILDAAIVTADGLEKVRELPEAEQVLSEAKRRFSDHDTNPNLLALIDKQTSSVSEGLYTDKEVVAEALLDLATDSHEVLAMV